MSFKGSQEPKKTAGNRFIRPSLMSIETFVSCRKRVGRLTDKGRLGGWRSTVDGGNGSRETWFRGARRVRGVPKRGDGVVWQCWPGNGSPRCKQILTTSRQKPTGTAGVEKGQKTELSLRPEGGMEGQKTEAPRPSGRRASCGIWRSSSPREGPGRPDPSAVRSTGSAGPRRRDPQPEASAVLSLHSPARGNRGPPAGASPVLARRRTCNR
jgi:hypothetical protein